MDTIDIKEEIANSLLREAAALKKIAEPIEINTEQHIDEALWFANKMYEENREDFS